MEKATQLKKFEYLAIGNAERKMNVILITFTNQCTVSLYLTDYFSDQWVFSSVYKIRQVNYAGPKKITIQGQKLWLFRTLKQLSEGIV